MAYGIGRLTRAFRALLGRDDAQGSGAFDGAPEDAEIWRRVRPFTMTSPERVAALLRAVSFVCSRGIEGDFVECGVWKGGSAMAAALALRRAGDERRKLWLYDTFEGMSAPTDADKDLSGASAADLLAEADKDELIWCRSSLEDVRAALASTGMPSDRIECVRGKVEDTIPSRAPERIALLRLDTDWYESTRHELEHLYPRLSPGGVLIIDDYGHWQGARRAVDEYFRDKPVLLHPIDYTGRIAQKL